LVLEALDVVLVELSERLPVEVAKLVARGVLLVLRKLDALPLVRALVQAGEDALHQRPRPKLDAQKARQRLRVEEGQGVTSSRSWSTSLPEVMPSDSAWKFGSTRCWSTGRARARTSSAEAA